MSQQARRLNDPSKRNEQILLDLLKIETNKYCADCGQKGNALSSAGDCFILQERDGPRGISVFSFAFVVEACIVPLERI
jgi:hypothetical protein